MVEIEPKARLLIVDDDAGRQKSIAQLFGDRYQIAVTADPAAVPDAALGSDVILLNVQANRVHPYKLLRGLKSGANTAEKPIVVLAPAESVESVLRCLEMGSDDFILAPFEPELVSARIESVLGIQRLRAALAEQQVKDQRSEAELKGQEKFIRDVLVARQIQQGFLPTAVPTVPGWDIAGRFQPAREVAGDWWDAFMLPKTRLIGLVIADVCDKGVGAALFMALMRSLIRAFAEIPWPSEVLDVLDTSSSAALPVGRRQRPTAGSTGLHKSVEETNNYIAHNHGDTGMFATLFFGLLDPATGMLQYVNGGHEPPMIITPKGEIRARLKPTGMAVGMLEGSSFTIETVHLDPGEMLLAYTDGVTEARDPDRAFFGEERLIKIASRPAANSNVLLERVMDNLRAHIADADQFDDITMIAVHRAPA